MGKESTLKTLRQQLRNVVKAELPSVLSLELAASIRKDIGAKVDAGLERLNKVVTDKLNEIDNRSKDLQKSFITGAMSKPLDAAGLVPLPTEPAPDAKPAQE